MLRLRLLGLSAFLTGVALIVLAWWRVHAPWRFAIGAPCHGLLAVILLLPAGLLLMLFGAHLATGPAWARRRASASPLNRPPRRAAEPRPSDRRP